MRKGIEEREVKKAGTDRKSKGGKGRRRGKEGGKRREGRSRNREGREEKKGMEGSNGKVQSSRDAVVRCRHQYGSLGRSVGYAGGIEI